MKKLSKLSLAIVAPTLLATSLIPLTSCSDRWNYIDPQIRFGEHVNGITHTNILLYDSFTIKLSKPAKGYDQFDTSKTTVSIGGKYVEYTLADPTTIVVPAEAVTSTDINLYIEGKISCQNVRVSWSEEAEKRFDVILGNPQCHVKDDLGEADTIKYSDFKIEALWGDPAKKDWRPIDINDSGLDIFYFDYSKWAYDKITDSFKKEGRTFTEKDFRVDAETGKYKHTQFKFAFRYRTNTFVKELRDLDSVYGEVCYHTKSLSISKKPAGDKLKCGDSFTFTANVEPELASIWYEFEITQDSGTGSYFESALTLVAGDTPGTITIRAKALPHETKAKPSEEYTITIEPKE